MKTEKQDLKELGVMIADSLSDEDSLLLNDSDMPDSLESYKAEYLESRYPTRDLKHVVLVHPRIVARLREMSRIFLGLESEDRLQNHINNILTDHLKRYDKLFMQTKAELLQTMKPFDL